MGNSYAILGLGSFGTKLAHSLSDLGNTVLVCDISRSRVDELRDKVAEAVIADASNPDAIKELGGARQRAEGRETRLRKT